MWGKALNCSEQTFWLITECQSPRQLLHRSLAWMSEGGSGHWDICDASLTLAATWTVSCPTKKEADGDHTHITCQIPLCLSCQEWQSIQTKHKSFLLLLLPATPVEFLKRWQQHSFFITINPFYLFYSHSESSQSNESLLHSTPRDRMATDQILVSSLTSCICGYCGYCNPNIPVVPVKLAVCHLPGSMWKVHSFKL